MKKDLYSSGKLLWPMELSWATTFSARAALEKLFLNRNG
jgi:hypothetical protein